MKFKLIKTISQEPPRIARHTSVVSGNKIYSFGGFDGIENLFGVSIFDVGNIFFYC